MPKKPTSEKNPFMIHGESCEHVLLVPNGTYRNDKGPDDKGRGMKASSHCRVFQTPAPRYITGECLQAAVNELSTRGDATTLDRWAVALKKGLALEYQQDAWSDITIASDKVTDAKVFKLIVTNEECANKFRAGDLPGARALAIEIIKESKGFIPKANDVDQESYDLAKATWDQHE